LEHWSQKISRQGSQVLGIYDTSKKYPFFGHSQVLLTELRTKFGEQTRQLFGLFPQLKQFGSEQLFWTHVVEFIRVKFGAGHEQLKDTKESSKLS
jgi:hypothetical protein